MLQKGTVRSKTFWSGVIGIVAGVGLIAQGMTKEGIEAIVAGVVAIFLRDGIEKSINR